MSKDFENTFAEILEAMEEGRLSIEQCREQFPEDWEQLRRLLPLTFALRDAPPVIPSFNFRRSARRRLLAQLTPHTSSTRMPWKLPQLSNFIKFPKMPTMKPAMQLLIILVTIVALSTGVSTAYAYGNSLPGDTLYPLKTAMESVQLLLTFDHARDAHLQISLAQRRIGDMKALAAQGRYEDIQHAAEDYQSLIEETNETLRMMVLAGDPRTAEMGDFVQVTLFYDTLILLGLKDLVSTDTQGMIDLAIGASKSGTTIARQWVELYTSSPQAAPSQLPATTQINEGFDIPLPTDIACWPRDLSAEPPDGIPLCEEDQTPVPLPEDLILFCWPSKIPFDPPQSVPLCEEGQAPIPLPDNLNLFCWPREIAYDPPEGLRRCNEGELPLPLPEHLNLACWPTEIPYNAPDGIPYCENGSYPTPAPEELPCWPRGLPLDPPPGLPLCEPGALRAPYDGSSSSGDILGGGTRELLDDIRSQLVEEYCWPAWLNQAPPLGMPICPSN